MSNENYIKLKKSSLQRVPFDSYNKDFTFIVNGEEFPTNHIIADILSPKICQLHSVDPTIDSYVIKTQKSGDFSKFLNLITFKQNNISDQELPFVAEVVEALDLDTIKARILDDIDENTIDNIISKIEKHERNRLFYASSLDKEIDFLSSHFYELKEEQAEKLTNLSESSLIQIFSNSELRLNSEDQLLNTIGILYSLDSKYSYLYEFVDFINVTSLKVIEFLQKFDHNDLTTETWEAITMRLQQEIVKPKIENDQNRRKSRYETSEEKNGIKINFDGNNKFDGIINYIKKKSNGNIENSLIITSSSVGSQSNPIKNITLYENPTLFFYTANKPNQWVCFDFKDSKVILSHYLIQTNHQGEYNIKNWKIEGSNDNSSWEVIDEKTNCQKTQGKNTVCTFQIDNNEKEFRYIRIYSTGVDWKNSNYLDLCAVEFYGRLI